MSTNKNVKTNESEGDFKQWAGGTFGAQTLREDQLAVTQGSITLPESVAKKLGPKVSILWSESKHAVQVRKDGKGASSFRKASKSGKSLSVYARSLIKAKHIAKGRYNATFDEKAGTVTATVSIEQAQPAPAQ